MLRTAQDRTCGARDDSMIRKGYPASDRAKDPLFMLAPDYPANGDAPA